MEVHDFFTNFTSTEYITLQDVIETNILVSLTRFLQLYSRTDNDIVTLKRFPRYWSLTKETGGRLNKKDGLTRYGDSHVKDKTS